MRRQVKIKAEGENSSGKSYILRKIKLFLENEGFKVSDKSLKNNHELEVLNDM